MAKTLPPGPAAPWAWTAAFVAAGRALLDFKRDGRVVGSERVDVAGINNQRPDPFCLASFPARARVAGVEEGRPGCGKNQGHADTLVVLFP